MIIDTGNILLIGAVLLFFSIIAGKAGFRFGVPVLLLFLGVGMLFGSDGLGIQFNNPHGAQFIGMIALSIILFSGGMDTKYTEIKPVLGQGVILATLGVALTTAITGFFIYWITGLVSDFSALTLTESLLMAAVMSSTDSASVFSILRSKKQGLKEQLRPMLELESGSNDPMAYMLTLLLIQIIQTPAGETNLWYSFLMFIVQMSVGAVAGFLLGKMAVWLMNRLNIGNQSLYPILLLACVFFIFSITELVKGNGYLAVYIAGLVVGNHKIQHKKSVTTFFDGFTWLFQIVMFLTLGLLVNPRDLLPLQDWVYWWVFHDHSGTSHQCLFMPGSFQANEYQSQSICFLGRSPGRRSDHFRHLSADRPDSLCFPDFQCRIFHYDRISVDPGNHSQLYG